MKTVLLGMKLLCLMLAGVGGIAVAQEAPASLQPATRTAEGTYLAGAVGAPVKLIEYVSYTCPYCAIYEDVAADGRTARYLRSGALSVEVHHVIRDPVDLATSLLARCGSTDTFFERHHAFMERQSVTLSAITPELERVWADGTVAERVQRIAADTGLLEFAAMLGINGAEATQCLTDAKETALLEKLAGVRKAGNGLELTPSFVLNGKVLADIHTWAGVRSKLDQALVNTN